MVRKLKHTEIGDIPVDWELQTFDETFRVISNNTLSRENLNNRGGAVRNIHYGDILTKFPEVLDCSEDEIPFVNDLSLLSSSTHGCSQDLSGIRGGRRTGGPNQPHHGCGKVCIRVLRSFP